MTKRLIPLLALAGSLSLTVRAQVGSGWTPISETFKVQTSGCGTVNGNTFSITCGSSGTVKDRAEREYNTWTSGQHQFQGDCTVTSIGGNGISVKQTFQKNNGAWSMIAVQHSGNIYEVHNGISVGSFTIGSSFRINTVLDADHGTVDVYFNGTYKETVTGGTVPIYDKIGTYRLASGTGPITATWNNVLFWQGGTTNGGGSPDFSMTTTPSSQTVTAGNSTSYTTTVTALNGFNGTVSFSVSGLPSGTSAAFNPGSVTGSGSSTLTVTTSPSTPQGTYTLTVTGTSGSLSHSDNVTLIVNPQTVPDFSLSASPNSLTINQGANGTSTITVNPINGFTGSVSLSASGLPSGVTASFNPTSTTTTSTLTLSASSTAATGTATVTVTGVSGSLSHNTTISLTVASASTNNFAGTFQIQNEASSLVLNNQGSITNGSPITQWTIVTSSNLDWTFIATSNGYYQINSSKSGRDAVVQSASTAAGAKIVQWSFGSSGDDQWKPVQNSDGSYTFFNLHSGLVLADPGGSTSTSTQMDQETANGGSNQNWKLLKQ